MFEVKKIDDKIKWNNFLLNQPTQTGIFLQSAEWLDFQENLGHKTWRLASVDEQKNISSLCGIIKNQLPFKKNNFYTPRSPIGKPEELINEIIKISQKEKAIFIRVEPPNNNPSLISHFSLLRVIHVQPEKTLVLDLTKSEDELLAAMHEKTRYNIRLAEKKILS